MKKNRSNIFRDIYYQPYDDTTKVKLYSSSKASVELIQRMTLLKRLKVHNGCVNSVSWNSTGKLILSGSDDKHLVITNAFNYKVLTDHMSGHRANIFSAKFLPNSGDNRIVSCGGDGLIVYTDITRKFNRFNNQFHCHTGTTYEVATIPGDPHSFLSCGEDATVRWFDLRIKNKCNATRCIEDVLIPCKTAVTALSINPASPHQLAVGCADSNVRIYDRRMLSTPATGAARSSGPVIPLCNFTVPEFEGHLYRITSLNYSPDGQDVLVSYSSDHLYLFSVMDQHSLELRKNTSTKSFIRSPSPVRTPRRLRLRGDWSDTGPDARPERDSGIRTGIEIAQARPVLHSSLMQRMTDVLSRMLNDPAIRLALSSGGEDSLESDAQQQQYGQSTSESTSEPVEHRSSETTETDRGQIENPRVVAVEVIESQTDIGDHADPENTQPLDTSVPLDTHERELPQASGESSTVNDTLDENTVEIRSNVPIETASSQLDAPMCSTQFSSPSVQSNSNNSRGETRNDNDIASCSAMTNTQGGRMMEDLHDTLSTMREGYLEKHGSEPTVKLTYSDKSSTRATISLDVPNEMIRGPYTSEPSGSYNSGQHIRNSSSSDDDRCPAGPSRSHRGGQYSRNSSSSDDDPYTAGPSGSQPGTKYNKNTSSSDEDLATAGPSGYRSSERHSRRPSSSDDEAYTAGPSGTHIGTEHRRDSGSSKYTSDYNDLYGSRYSDDEDDEPKKRVYHPGKSKIDLYVKQKYMGHRNARTMIKEANFWGDDFVMSGSDCGHVFVWERDTARLCMLLEADQHVVNCVQPHPFLPLLATSGIDYDVKLWAPTNEEPNFDEKFADDLQKRNAVMLEETKDTITVPAVFMIRMLACLNQIRRGRRRNRRSCGDRSGDSRDG